MRVFVTGGAGFIGSRFVRGLLADEYVQLFPDLGGAAVTVFDNFTYAGNPANLAAVADNPRLRVIRGDVTSGADLDGALPGHDLVVNLAAETHVDRSLAAADAFVRTNVVGAQQVFDASLRHEVTTVVHVSTDEVYGPIEIGASEETSPLRPSSPYAASKAAADLVANAYVVSYGLDLRITRSTNTYGPFQYPEKIIPRFLTQLLRRQPVPLYGSGEQRREWLHVDDHCRALALIAGRGAAGEVYNVGGGAELSNRALTDLLLAGVGVDASYVEHVADPRGAGHDVRYAVDAAKIAALGFTHHVDFEAGLAATVRWYCSNPQWWQPLLSPS